MPNLSGCGIAVIILALLQVLVNPASAAGGYYDDQYTGNN
eukprot:CAMPEP_0197234490 /NCGR_PEP_ID=MMETSP1429-20130617/2234_1 /TAXON_ID=49237 /ORGANISM="Chaetoceros  sp., Strain UNC1202" /LENGTH=39 /DNA_ID= /DNA_START= /DNA_END= /DNA_ORIENTATION=